MKFSWNNRLTVTKCWRYLSEEYTLSFIVCANSKILWPHCWKGGRWKTDIRNTKQPDVGRGNYLHKMQRAILQKKTIYGHIQLDQIISEVAIKVLFTNHYTWQNFCLRLLRLVNNCAESIYKAQKSETKVLPCVMFGEKYFRFFFSE